MVHEGDGSVFLKKFGLGMFRNHYGECVVPLLRASGLPVIRSAGKCGEETGDLSDLFERKGF